ncbi:unnamed protein product [Schistosoma margrebowiei]|uniref:Uncharacterized protein n=1 Tax=Schistosoma margrebowiei TaxID=48269 RepID=A0AA85AMU7_9TREM|nr:unnamed protein product [Schistosoma margrebowiei]
MKLAFDNVSNVTCQDNSTCIFFWYTDPVVLSAIILTLIGLFVGLLIILIKKLHSTSIMNSIIMVITLIILIIDVALLNLHTKWYEIIISVTVDTTLTSLAISLGVKLRVPEGKLEIILFSMWCVFGGIGIILLIVGAALFNVIVYTAYYLCEEEQSRVMYNIFLWFSEYIALIFVSQFSLNLLMDCYSSGENTEGDNDWT